MPGGEILHGFHPDIVPESELMPDGLVRAPHGSRLPEVREGDGGLSGAWDHADAQLCADDPEFLDAEQGIPHIKRVPCTVRPAPA